MKNLGLAILLAIAPVTAFPFAAQAPADAFTVYGAGTGSCSVWTEHLNDRALHPADAQWVFGFVSAAGVFAGIHLKVDANGIEPFMAKYCQEHPMDTITTAAATLVGTLR